MDNDDLDRYLKAEIKYIEDAKWFEGIRTHTDPGDFFIQSWIISSANNFRLQWEQSCCRFCQCDCRDNLKPKCDNFKSFQFIQDNQ